MRKDRLFRGGAVLLAMLAVCVVVSRSVMAQGRGHAAAKAHKEAKAEAKAEEKHDKKVRAAAAPDAKVVVVDRDGHVRIIREYGHGGSLPPGLAKRQALPPGLRKQLHERGELPPGLQAHLIPVPPVLAARLPPVPVYYQRYFAGDDLIIVDTRTHRIATIVVNVW